MTQNLHDLLNKKTALYNQPDFITNDPVSIPHRFTRQQDIEIAGLFAAILAWGNRKSIIASCTKLMTLMDNAPFDFVLHAGPKQLNRLKGFVHRTFNTYDLWHLLQFLQHHYSKQQSLETAFTQWMQPGHDTIEQALAGFHHYVFGFNEAAHEEKHCRKHISTPEKKSACKRLNMYLRWMVRQDSSGVDFGLWKNISPAQLVCPLDVHVARVARGLGLLQRKQNDWQAATELTHQLKQFDPADPVKYDYALFGLGVIEKY
ncbi:MAG TPA: TIGR02757 family protein [Ferruginibacter sp.]|nr:TIGR02757 family protein [Ferruginibacter sp.]HMP20625.1 TIGR02757 family protein [Ferruginibacter sp.]